MWFELSAKNHLAKLFDFAVTPFLILLTYVFAPRRLYLFSTGERGVTNSLVVAIWFSLLTSFGLKAYLKSSFWTEKRSEVEIENLVIGLNSPFSMEIGIIPVFFLAYVAALVPGVLFFRGWLARTNAISLFIICAGTSNFLFIPLGAMFSIPEKLFYVFIPSIAALGFFLNIGSLISGASWFQSILFFFSTTFLTLHLSNYFEPAYEAVIGGYGMILN
ncbi:hypothetical protein [Pseudooceanicola nitratireducens]|uniref:hypothetical protein n=1 Tax=Pseudooceanicola nitratireducens TaxID=517719 RepID=UPI0023F09899|nr:hypothetical protein [Pseudooceanicola nitratireducens]